MSKVPVLKAYDDGVWWEVYTIPQYAQIVGKKEQTVRLWIKKHLIDVLYVDDLLVIKKSNLKRKLRKPGPIEAYYEALI